MYTYAYYCIYDDFMLKRGLLPKGTETLIRYRLEEGKVKGENDRH